MAGRPVEISGSAFEWSSGGWSRIGPRYGPREDEGEGIDVTLRQDRIAKLRPAVAHQVGAVEQVGGVPQAKGVANLVERHPAEILDQTTSLRSSRRLHASRGHRVGGAGCFDRARRVAS